LFKIKPPTIPNETAAATYKIVIFQPNNPAKSTTAIWLTKGETIKNDKVTPRGIPASKKPINNGIDEQEQNGVIAPKIAAKK